MGQPFDVILAELRIRLRLVPVIDLQADEDADYDNRQLEKHARPMVLLHVFICPANEQGKPYTVRYEAVNAMLLNEFLREHRVVQDQQKAIIALTRELKEQREQIQKVNAKLETTRPATRLVSTK